MLDEEKKSEKSIKADFMQKITILKGEMAKKTQEDDKHIAEVEKEHKDELKKTESQYKS